MSLVEAARLFQVALEFERLVRGLEAAFDELEDAQAALAAHEWGFTGEWLERLHGEG